MKSGLVILLLVCIVNVNTQQKADSVGTIATTSQTTVQEPGKIQQGDIYNLFCTRFGMSFFSSKDLKSFEKQQIIFSSKRAVIIDFDTPFGGIQGVSGQIKILKVFT
jgi:hypothetical protein